MAVRLYPEKTSLRDVQAIDVWGMIRKAVNFPAGSTY